MRLIAFDHRTLGDRSYLVLDEAAGLAVAIDPQRDTEPYVAAAAAAGCRIAYALETHVHNDFISGARRLAVEQGAVAVASRAAGLAYAHRAVASGDTLRAGGLVFDVLETPGHTHEHVSYVLRGTPPVLFSGGALTPGGAARVDLFGPHETPRLAALAQRTIAALLALAPDVSVLATHVGGSFCSTGAHDAAATTVGHERERNRFANVADAVTFADLATRDVPPAPPYYPRVRRRNLVGELAAPPAPRELGHAALAALLPEVTVIDARTAAEYASAHVVGSIAIGLGGAFAPWVAWLAPDRRLALVVRDGADGRLATTSLGSVGLDDVDGYAVGVGAPLPLRDVARLPGREALAVAASVVDARWQHEWDAGHVPGARHAPPDRIADGSVRVVADGGPVAVHCAGDYRSAIAVSLLERAGVGPLVHVADGYAGLRGAPAPARV